MQPIEAMKFGLCTYPELKDDGAFSDNTYVDTKGWGHVRFLFIVGNTDIAVGSDDSSTPPKIEECDTTGGAYTAVTSAALSAVIGAGDDAKMFAIDIDLTKTHKRYMQVDDPTAGDGTTGAALCVIAILSRPSSGEFAGSAAQAGLEEKISA